MGIYQYSLVYAYFFPRKQRAPKGSWLTFGATAANRCSAAGNRYMKGMNTLTTQEYAAQNYRFLNRQQAMLFISHGARLMDCYVSHNALTDEYNMVYVFEKNKENDALLARFRSYELSWGNHIIEFEGPPAIIIKNRRTSAASVSNRTPLSLYSQ